ncbi:MAG: membrane dipeptidase [Cyclobacteriaceae bacterium]|nr:membrane dipeptidase [Cyclobacteriaceae bacterium]
MFTRRKFLQTSAVLAAAPLFAHKGFPITEAPIPVIDFHTHPGLFFAKGSEKFLGEAALSKTLTEMKTSSVLGAFISLVADARIISVGAEGVKPAGNFKPGEAWADYKRQLQLAQACVAEGGFTLATTTTSLKEQTVSAFLSCEGGDYLEGDAGRLEEMHRDGIRSIQLVHYHPNELGDLQTEASQHNGLSAAGKQVIKRMNKLGMLIDLAHASYATTRAAALASDAPIIVSHSMLQTDSVHPLAKRQISKEHALVVAKTGGLIGMWPCGLNKDLNDFADNTLRLIEVVGIDHVGLGTDMDGNYKPVVSGYPQVQAWLAALAQKGLTKNDLEKVASGNAKRVLQHVLK